MSSGLLTSLRTLALVATATCAIACGGAGRASVPAGARVEPLQTSMLVLRGTAESAPTAACSGTETAAPRHYVELTDDANGLIRLRPVATEKGAAIAMLHVTHLDSNRTWCVSTARDGASPTIPGGFRAGVYAISVVEAGASRPHGYEVVVEKL